MAGIGIELRQLTKNQSLSGFIRANGYAAILSSSSWLISICTLILIYLFLISVLGKTLFSIQFLVGVTYLASFSLIVSGPFQQSLVRYIADMIYEKKFEKVTGTLVATSLIVMILSAMVGLMSLQWLLPAQNWLLKLIMLSSFVTLNMTWIFSNTLAGLKKYRFIIIAFLISYLVIFLSAITLYRMHLIGLMLGYYVGQVLMLTSFYVYSIKTFPTNHLFNWDFLNYLPKNVILMANGFLFQIGLWVDKYIFWFSPKTGIPLLGHLSASPIYDMPMFIAFLIMLPGLAVYFYEVEANFSYYYHRYYNAILDGATLSEINDKHREQVVVARTSLLSMLKIQGFFAAVAILFAQEILHAIGLAPIYLFLFRIDIVSASLMVLLISLVNLLYYLNKSKSVWYVVLVLFMSNLLFSLVSLNLLPMFYGYGFLTSMALTNLIAIVLLRHAFNTQTFHAFMDY